jgi:hypothetical protein
MTAIVLTAASSGATRNAGTNGDLVALLDWGLAQKSWAVEYTAANQRIYRAASGNRHRLQVLHDSAISGAAQRAVFRGCENASDTVTLTDPFPTVAQVASTSCNVLVSTSADTTTRPFYLIVEETWFAYFSQSGGSTWSGGAFGDAPGAETGDTYGTFIWQRNSTSNSVVAWPAPSDGSSGAHTVHWCRDRSGATKATTGGLFGINATAQWGNRATVPAARAGYGNRVRREKVGVNCSGSATTAANSMMIDRRGWLPHLWSPMHSGLGTLVEGDTMTDTAYHASANFVVLTLASGFALLETSTTWAPPGG